VGRRHLSRAAALATIVALALAAPAGASIAWTLVSDGVAHHATLAAPVGYIALDRAEASGAFTAGLPAAAVAKVDATDFSRTALVVVYGEFGCLDSLIDVTALEQHGSMLAVALTQSPPKPGKAVCMAIYPTYRILAIGKASLRTPYPTRVSVTLART